MLDKMLDKLLTMHSSRLSSNTRLDGLEQDVWCKIKATSTEMALPWYDKMMMAFSVPQFRMASIVIALLIGVSASSVFTFGPSSQNVPDLSVFTMQSPYLPSNLIEHME